MRETPPSSAEKAFVLNTIRSGLRVDLRGAYDLRKLSISLGPALGHADVRLGTTRVIAHVHAEVVRPQDSDPNEGFLRFTTECSPMASPRFESGSLSDEEVLISRLLERTFRRSRAIDTENLCIVSGEKVWAISVDVRLIDLDGNAVDAACIAAAAALLHFRRPDVTVVGDEVKVHSLDERNPVPLSVHHVPICVTFAILDEGQLMVLDPTSLEEDCRCGDVTFSMNAHREVCAVAKSGGAALPIDALLRCAKVATWRSLEIHEALQKSLKDSLLKRWEDVKLNCAWSFRRPIAPSIGNLNLNHSVEEHEETDRPYKSNVSINPNIMQYILHLQSYDH
ncbi:hypothetical protein M427DRAFT_101213 [Gonapodya prolifera JEL478]|uniref:Exosome complex component RRP45 n=1 Tax=Gonapodya prolifera (strain JEL478) TaxID=1344416 RepID=A0A139A784_GONPJ|nr:hypothetical protein M427DRAFT_101213 [Gonapodya prolifera JEL478]|eukprot:KXS12660.1 hypothetical protein M427DRAFT_101213 [Gonapodya prolifera JEL478]